jgi:hypothetical protein
VAAVHVGRASQQWLIRAAEGNFCSFPSADNPRDECRPFSPTDETELETVPGYYKSILGLPLWRKASDP